MTRAVVVVLLALSAIIITTHQAGARQGGTYVGPIFGDLTISGDATPGSAILLSGDGFSPDSTIMVLVTSSATAEVAHQADTAAAGDGSASVVIEIGNNLLGNYTVALKGQTVDGSTLELSGAILVAPEPALVSYPTPVPAQSSAADGTTTTTEVDALSETASSDASGNSDVAATAAAGIEPTTGSTAAAGDVGAEADEEASAIPGGDGGSSSGARTIVTVSAALLVLASGAGLWWRKKNKYVPEHV